MKILIATGVYPPDIGGPATYTKMIEEHLPKRGYEIVVLPFSSVRHLPKVVRHIAYFVKCVSRARDADAIFAQDPLSVGLPSLLAAQLLRKKFFLRLGGDYAWEQGRLRFGVIAPLETFARAHEHYPFMVRFFKRIQTVVASRAERVAVQSACMQKIVACWGIPAERIIVIPNGFEVTTASADKATARKMLGIHGMVAVSAGRLVPWKGFEGLIEVVPEILKTMPDFVLYIIGDGPDEAKLHAFVEERELGQQVRFTGRLDKKTLIHYLVAADVFVLNTEYEGFSNQLLEAYATGTPVVTTDIGGNKGVVEHGESGLVVPLHDSIALKDTILEILADKNLAKKLTDGGKKKLREFTVERAVTTTHEFLSSR